MPAHADARVLQLGDDPALRKLGAQAPLAQFASRLRQTHGGPHRPFVFIFKEYGPLEHQAAAVLPEAGAAVLGKARGEGRSLALRAEEGKLPRLGVAHPLAELLAVLQVAGQGPLRAFGLEAHLHAGAAKAGYPILQADARAVYRPLAQHRSGRLSAIRAPVLFLKGPAEARVILVLRQGPRSLGGGHQARENHILKPLIVVHELGPKVGLNANHLSIKLLRAHSPGLDPGIREGVHILERAEAVPSASNAVLLPLHKIEVHGLARAEHGPEAAVKHIVKALHIVVAPPHHHIVLRVHPEIHYIVPAYHLLAQGFDAVGHGPDEIALSLHGLAVALPIHQSLDVLVGKPGVGAVGHLVPAYHDPWRWEEGGHLAQNLRQEGVSLGLAHIEGEVRETGGHSPARVLGIGLARSRSVAGHVDFRDDLDMALRRVLDNFANLLLRVVLRRGVYVRVRAPAAHAREIRVGLDLYPPALRVRQVPVEAVELEPGHLVEQPFDLLHSEEMPCLVEHETAPGEARSVFDYSHGEPACGELLVHGLLRVEGSGRIGRGHAHPAVCPHLENIGFRSHRRIHLHFNGLGSADGL